MQTSGFLKSAFLASAATFAFAAAASAGNFNIPGGDLASALNAYTEQSGVSLIVSGEAVRGVHTRGVSGSLNSDEALSRILDGTGFIMQRRASGAVTIMRDQRSEIADIQIAQATPSHASVETVTVTSSKLGGADVQSVPIAITALSQEQLTATQTAGGPDLIKQVPNLTFTKTNFTGYSIQIRGIGTQAISVTTDPAVAVAFNDTPFIRNHFFEQEFFDVAQVEVLRGPQGTLYGRNATAGVVNLISAKPSDQFEAMASGDIGNYQNRRVEGMINLPIVDDRVDLRVAGEWTKRKGYSFNETTDKAIDGRDLWSTRVTLGLKPLPGLNAYLVWEHFQEDDDRVRSAKQLCKKDLGPTVVDGLDLATTGNPNFFQSWLSQGCLPASFYSPEAFQTPNGQSLPFVAAGEFIFNGAGGSAANGFLLNQIDPYASTTQSTNLRNIQSAISPTYKARNDVFELNADYELTPELTFTSQSAYNQDLLRSTEDFNRFNTAPGLFGTLGGPNSLTPGGVYCDPQVGCSDRMVAEDLSQEHAWQFSQEFRLVSHFSGPLNFSVGANYLRYSTIEDYYVFFNLVSAIEQLSNGQGPFDFTTCHPNSGTPFVINPVPATSGLAFGFPGYYPSNFGCGFGGGGRIGTYIDPNPITDLDGNGHNYFRSENPYNLNSWAGFGEAYYQLASDVKVTGGLRFTDDKKTFKNIPSWVFLVGGGYPVLNTVRQEWKEVTGRFNVDWTPKLNFTDQTLLYASYGRGYKGGGANPPGPTPNEFSSQSFLTHPATFDPEFVNAFELGTKNTLLDGGMTLNADVFYYDYKGYQISQIVDRTSINLNIDAKVKGVEVEGTWEPIPGLRFNFAGGYEDGTINDGQSAIDLIDRTAGHTDWMVVKPFPTSTSNCIFPSWVVRELILNNPQGVDDSAVFNGFIDACDAAYGAGKGLFGDGYDHNLTAFGVTGFDASQSPNNGEGFAKDLGGNKLPNTPPFTLSFGAQYTMPVTDNWAATLRGDFYWQGNSYARIFNDKPYDQLHGYSTANIALILTSGDGWQAMGYVKNVFDKTAITGAFLNSDDTALTTNVFLTDPRLFGVRITKNF
ncbi:MAG TPA: TonB-dependent receptor [Rhizomicrobium sp.]|nr:TonB-dependent receptor [Rhizomicrobium sp.]